MAEKHLKIVLRIHDCDLYVRKPLEPLFQLLGYVNTCEATPQY